MYTLSEHGDDIEKRFYPLFIKTRFPSYEQFWLCEVIPVTNRQPLSFKSDEELRAIGKSPWNHYIAQLHYSVIFHLATAYLFVLKTDGEMEYTQLMHAMTSIVAAQDVAYKLLKWWTIKTEEETRFSNIIRQCEQEAATNHTSLIARFENEARYYDRKWRKKEKPRISDVAEYRNAMVHRGVGTVRQINGISQFPQVGKEDKYRDWRTVPSPEDYSPASGVLWPSWRRTVEYIEEQWQNVLLHTEE